MTRHVWVSRKVTPWAGVQGRYARYSYRWIHPQRDRERAWAASLARWKHAAPPTVADVATDVRMLCGVNSHFRLVDASGRSYGPRYVRQGRMRSAPVYNAYLCQDNRGREVWLPGDTRCRPVVRQPEDPHSAACRALKRAHRLGLQE